MRDRSLPERLSALLRVEREPEHKPSLHAGCAHVAVGLATAEGDVGVGVGGGGTRLHLCPLTRDRVDDCFDLSLNICWPLPCGQCLQLRGLYLAVGRAGLGPLLRRGGLLVTRAFHWFTEGRSISMIRAYSAADAALVWRVGVGVGEGWALTLTVGVGVVLVSTCGAEQPVSASATASASAPVWVILSFFLSSSVLLQPLPSSGSSCDVRHGDSTQPVLAAQLGAHCCWLNGGKGRVGYLIWAVEPFGDVASGVLRAWRHHDHA